MYQDTKKNLEQNNLPRHVTDSSRIEKKAKINRSFSQEDAPLGEEKQILQDFITARTKAAQDTCTYVRSVYKKKANKLIQLRKENAKLQAQLQANQKEQQKEILHLKSKHDDELKKMKKKYKDQKQFRLSQMKKRQKSLQASREEIEQKDKLIKETEKRIQQRHAQIAFYQDLLKSYRIVAAKMIEESSKLSQEYQKWNSCKMIVSLMRSKSKDITKAGQKLFQQFQKLK